MDEDVARQKAGKHDVIGIEETDVGSARRQEAFDGGDGLTVVAGASDDFQRGISLLERGDDGRAVVGRGIVENDAFDARIGLFEDGADGGLEIGAVIVIDDDDADERQVEPGDARRVRFAHRPRSPAIRASARRAKSRQASSKAPPFGTPVTPGQCAK